MKKNTAKLNFLYLITTSCGPAPQVTDTNFYSPQTKHERFTLPCATCHEDTRLPTLADIPHGLNQDCVNCHTPTDTTISSPWTPKEHEHGNDQACGGCHARSRPASPHAESGDCVTCHEYPSWTK